MPQVLESIFDLLVNHLRMLRWHEAAIAQHQSQVDCLQVWVLLGDQSLDNIHTAVAAAQRPSCPRASLLLYVFASDAATLWLDERPRLDACSLIEQAELHQRGSSSARRVTEPATSYSKKGCAGLRTTSASATSTQTGNSSSDTDTAATTAGPPQQAQAAGDESLLLEDSDAGPKQLPSTTGQEQQVHHHSVAYCSRPVCCYQVSVLTA
jgi:hypothetical protein